MKYANCYPAIFLSRPNRFIAVVEVDGVVAHVHVKNTGRCRELLVPGCVVYLERSRKPSRKTAYDLVAVEKQTPDGMRLVNMDSMAPNRAAAEWLAAGGLGRLEELRAETTVGDSRFDFTAVQNGQPVAIEVKGCTLEQDGVARFPDAPTLRGIKHVQGLTALKKAGWRCIVLIVIQMKGVHCFQPNWASQPEFGCALQEAAAAGVEVIAVDCAVQPDTVTIDERVEVDLSTRPRL